MDLKNISNDELVQRLEKLVRTERKITHLVLLHIAEIEDRKIYAEMGFDGMYAYLTRGLGYSEGSAYRRLQSARLLKQVPQVAEKIESGALNLTQLTQVQKCVKEELRAGKNITTERTESILEVIENKNTFETQKALAIEFNQPVQTREYLKPQADDSVVIELTLSKDQFQELETAKSLLSHVCPDGSWADVIATLANNFNKKKLGDRGRANSFAESKSTNKPSVKNEDSLKDERNLTVDEELKTQFKVEIESKNKANTIPGAATTGSRTQRHYFKNAMSPSNAIQATNHPLLSTRPAIATGFPSRHRQYISIHKKRALFNRAHHRCEYIDHKTHRKCQSKFMLEIDHIHPLALGGDNNFGNLRVLCRTHNTMAARQMGIASYDRNQD